MAGDNSGKQCTICGSRFAERKCYFCDRKVCTSCVMPSEMSGGTSKCLDCDRRKVNRLGFAKLMRRNGFIIGIVFGFWVFAIFPLPFLHLAGVDVDPSAFQPVLIATAILVIPFIFMFVAWQKRAPRGSA